MTKTYLLVDVPNLAHRAFHTPGFGEIKHNGKSVGVIFGVLRDLVYLRDRFAADQIVLCFDHGESKRKQLFPGYKANRGAQIYTKMPIMNPKVLSQQMRVMKDRLFEELGFANVLYEEGYEADDIIASVCKKIPRTDTAIIVSSDHDLYQCFTGMGPFIIQWAPQQKRLLDVNHILLKGVGAWQWAKVKAIAGCKSDCIPGVTEVGESRAIAYINGTLPKHYKSYTRIEEQRERWEANLKLTTLPFPGCPVYRTLETDDVTREMWDTVCKQYGFTSLIGKWSEYVQEVK